MEINKYSIEQVDFFKALHEHGDKRFYLNFQAVYDESGNVEDVHAIIYGSKGGLCPVTGTLVEESSVKHITTDESMQHLFVCDKIFRLVGYDPARDWFVILWE